MKKGLAVLFIMLFVVMGVFAGNSDHRFVGGNGNEVLQIVSEDDNYGQGVIFINIGIGDNNKASVNIFFTEGTLAVYGSDAVPVYYNFDGGGNSVATGRCVNSNLAVMVMNNISDLWQGIVSRGRLNVKIIGYDGTQYNYSFDLNSVRKAMRDAGMNI